MKVVETEIIDQIDQSNLEDWKNARNNPSEVLVSARQNLQKAKAANYQKGIAWAEGNIGAAQVWSSNYEEALSHTTKARQLLQKVKDGNHESDILYNLCVIFYFLGDYKRQLEYAMDALDVAKKNDYLSGQANAYNGIGLAYYTTSENEKAIEYLLNGKEIAQEIGDHSTLLKILDGLGQAYFNLEDYDKALNYKTECASISGELGEKSIQAFALDGIGEIYYMKKDPESALDHCMRSLAIRKELGFKSGEAENMMHIGEIYLMSGDFDLAGKNLNEAIKIAEEIKAYEIISRSNKLLADHYEKVEDLILFIKHYKAYHQARDSYNKESETKKLKTFELKGRLEQMEEEKKLLQDKNDQLNQYFEDVETLSKIGNEITSSLSVTAINQIVYENVNTLMPADGFGIGIYDPETNILTFPGYIEQGKVFEETNYDLNDNDRMACVCFNKELEILINNFEEEHTKYVPQLVSPKVGKASQSLIYLPLKVKDKKIGVITIQSLKENAYTEYHLNILRNLGIYISIALDNAQLYENMEEQVEVRTKELEQNHKNIELLNRIGQDLISTLDFENVIERLYKNVNELMPAQIFGVRLLDEEAQMIDYKYDYENGDRHEEIVVSMDDDNNYSVWCIKNNSEIFINDNENEYSRYVEEVKVVAGEYPQSLIFFPLRRNGKPFGLITVQSLAKNAYTNYHLNILKTLAHYTAIGLENARHYEIMEEEVKKRTKELHDANITIQKKNKDITDSINYAKRIQSALMPDDTQLIRSFDSFFYLYKPKDIVSGDFYWFHDFGNVVVSAVGDCTGHGVPGALMSVICVTQINKHVKSDSVQNPARALKLINDGIVETLKQHAVNVNSYDGMDIAMCSYNKETGILEYSGAFRPLIVINNKKLTEYDPNRFSLGGDIIDQKKFKQHQIQLLPNDRVYMYTDGYADQFGGPDNKKYLTKRFKEMLTDISHLSFEKQREILEKNFNDWRQDHEQVDDILVMGFKV